MDFMIWVWLGIVAASIIIELSTFQLVSVWFAAGGLVSLILAACGVGLEWQIIVFLVISIALLIGVRKITLKLLQKSGSQTNIDALIGKTAELVEPIRLNQPGAVKFNGVTWSAYTKTSDNIAVGTLVEVASVEGNKLIVKRASAEQTETKQEKTQNKKEIKK